MTTWWFSGTHTFWFLDVPGRHDDFLAAIVPANSLLPINFALLTKKPGFPSFPYGWAHAPDGPV